MVEISVIISVYNTGKYLEESMNTILKQRFTDIEILCINDGSNNKSLKFLKHLAKKDDRIIIINQTPYNSGNARNIGLRHAKGDYIYLFDAGDLLIYNGLEKFHQYAKSNNSDIVVSRMTSFKEGEDADFSNPVFDLENIFPFEDFYHFTFTYEDIKHYVLNASFNNCIKFFKKEFLDKYPDELTFPTNTGFVDIEFHISSLLKASRISFCPYNIYRYRTSNHRFDTKNKSPMDIFKICDNVEKFLKDNNFYEEFIAEFYEFKIKQIMKYLIPSNSEKYYDRAKEEFKKFELNNAKMAEQYINQCNSLLKSDNFEKYKEEANKPFSFKKISKNDYSDSPKVSVIIPAYNEEKFLRECLDSVINQTLKNIEIICVNDCSTDDTLNIFEEYSQKDDRIKVFSTPKNSGLSAARNLGLDHATGEYVDFLDSDDWLDLNTFKETYDFAKTNDVDLLMYQLINYNNEKDEFFESEVYNLNALDSEFDEEIFNFMDISDALLNIPVSACNKLIKNDLIKSLNLRFLEGYMFEDNPFSHELFLNSPRMSIIRKHYYNRRRTKESMTAVGSEKFIDSIFIYNSVIKIYENEGLFDYFKADLINNKIFSQKNRYDLIKDEFKEDFYWNVKEDLERIKSHTYYFDLYKKYLMVEPKIFATLVLCSKNHDDFSNLIKLHKTNKLSMNISLKNKKYEDEINFLNKKILFQAHEGVIYRNKIKKVQKNNKDLNKRNKTMKEENKKLKRKLKEFKSRKAVKLIDKIKKLMNLIKPIWK